MMPWSPRIAIQPYVRATAEVNRGAIASAIRTPFHFDVVRVRNSAIGYARMTARPPQRSPSHSVLPMTCQ